MQKPDEMFFRWAIDAGVQLFGLLHRRQTAAKSNSGHRAAGASNKVGMRQVIRLVMFLELFYPEPFFMCHDFIDKRIRRHIQSVHRRQCSHVQIEQTVKSFVFKIHMACGHGFLAHIRKRLTCMFPYLRPHWAFDGDRLQPHGFIAEQHLSHGFIQFQQYSPPVCNFPSQESHTQRNIPSQRTPGNTLQKSKKFRTTLGIIHDNQCWFRACKEDDKIIRGYLIGEESGKPAFLPQPLRPFDEEPRLPHPSRTNE